MAPDLTFPLMSLATAVMEQAKFGILKMQQTIESIEC